MIFGLFNLLGKLGKAGINKYGKNKTERLQIKATGILGAIKLFTSENAAIGIVSTFCASVFYFGTGWAITNGYMDFIDSNTRLIITAIIFTLVLFARTARKIFEDK